MVRRKERRKEREKERERRRKEGREGRKKTPAKKQSLPKSLILKEKQSNSKEMG